MSSICPVNGSHSNEGFQCRLLIMFLVFLDSCTGFPANLVNVQVQKLGSIVCFFPFSFLLLYFSTLILRKNTNILAIIEYFGSNLSLTSKKSTNLLSIWLEESTNAWSNQSYLDMTWGFCSSGSTEPSARRAWT